MGNLHILLANNATADTQNRGPQTRAGQERINFLLTQSKQVNQVAANSFRNTGEQSGMGQAGTQTENVGSKSAVTSCLNLLQMPQRLDPHEPNLDYAVHGSENGTTQLGRSREILA